MATSASGGLLQEKTNVVTTCRTGWRTRRYDSAYCSRSRSTVGLAGNHFPKLPGPWHMDLRGERRAALRERKRGHRPWPIAWRERWIVGYDLKLDRLSAQARAPKHTTRRDEDLRQVGGRAGRWSMRTF